MCHLKFPFPPLELQNRTVASTVAFESISPNTRMKACPVMLHQGALGLVKANTGERREQAEARRSPPTPLACLQPLPTAAFTWHQRHAEAVWS